MHTFVQMLNEHCFFLAKAKISVRFLARKMEEYEALREEIEELRAKLS